MTVISITCFQKPKATSTGFLLLLLQHLLGQVESVCPSKLPCFGDGVGPHGTMFSGRCQTPRQGCPVWGCDPPESLGTEPLRRDPLSPHTPCFRQNAAWSLS